MAKIFVASRNAKKIAEMERILAPHLPGVEVLGLDDVDFYDEPVEDAPTFEGNAVLKARAAFEATGLPSVADDSGICVDALNGMPGILSARWSGKPKSDERNNQLLLEQLEDVSDDRRGGHYTCVIAFIHGAGTAGEVVVEGRMQGQILRAPQGEGGFGYDPLFVPDAADGRSAGQLSATEKDAISHRGNALREIAPLIAAVI